MWIVPTITWFWVPSIEKRLKPKNTTVFIVKWKYVLKNFQISIGDGSRCFLLVERGFEYWVPGVTPGRAACHFSEFVEDW
jgi:hypothetical protein